MQRAPQQQQPQAPSQQPVFKVFLTGIAVEFDKAELNRFFKLRFPSVIRVDLIKQKENPELNKGFGFVELYREEEQQAIIRQEYFYFSGRVFSAKEHKTGQDLERYKDTVEKRRLFICNVNLQATDKELKEFFSQYTLIENAYLVNRSKERRSKRGGGSRRGAGRKICCGYGYVVVKYASDAPKILDIKEFWIKGKKAIVKPFNAQKHRQLEGSNKAKNSGQREDRARFQDQHRAADISSQKKANEGQKRADLTQNGGKKNKKNFQSQNSTHSHVYYQLIEEDREFEHQEAPREERYLDSNHFSSISVSRSRGLVSPNLRHQEEPSKEFEEGSGLNFQRFKSNSNFNKVIHQKSTLGLRGLEIERGSIQSSQGFEINHNRRAESRNYEKFCQIERRRIISTIEQEGKLSAKQAISHQNLIHMEHTTGFSHQESGSRRQQQPQTQGLTPAWNQEYSLREPATHYQISSDKRSAENFGRDGYQKGGRLGGAAQTQGSFGKSSQRYYQTRGDLPANQGDVFDHGRPLSPPEEQEWRRGLDYHHPSRGSVEGPKRMLMTSQTESEGFRMMTRTNKNQEQQGGFVSLRSIQYTSMSSERILKSISRPVLANQEEMRGLQNEFLESRWRQISVDPQADDVGGEAEESIHHFADDDDESVSAYSAEYYIPRSLPLDSKDVLRNHLMAFRVQDNHRRSNIVLRLAEDAQSAVLSGKN